MNSVSRFQHTGLIHALLDLHPVFHFFTDYKWHCIFNFDFHMPVGNI